MRELVFWRRVKRTSLIRDDDWGHVVSLLQFSFHFKAKYRQRTQRMRVLFISPKTDVLAFLLVEFTEAETRLSQQQASARVGFGFFCFCFNLLEKLTAVVVF